LAGAAIALLLLELTTLPSLVCPRVLTALHRFAGVWWV